jgi:probable HAF family extracellular repeat protein
MKPAVIIIVVAMFCLRSTAHSQTIGPTPRPVYYSVTEVGALPGERFYGAIGYSMNALGEVVGLTTLVPQTQYGLTGHAFLYRNGRTIDLGALYNPALTTRGKSINLSGEVLVETIPGELHPSGAVYKNGHFTPVTSFPNGGSFHHFAGVNDFGQITGSYTTQSISENGFVIQPNGTITTIVPGGFVESIGINDLGQIIYTDDLGLVGFLLQPGGNIVEFSFYTTALNNLGVVTGFGTENTDHSVWAFMQTATGPRTRLIVPVSFIPPGGVERTFPTAINDFNTIVGYLDGFYSGTPPVPFIYRDGKMYDLNTLISVSAGVQITHPVTINDVGQILVNGLRPGDGYTHTFILTPSFR